MPYYGKGFTPTSANGTSTTNFLYADDNTISVESLVITSNSSQETTVRFFWNDGTTSRIIGSIDIPAGAGTDGDEKAIQAVNRAIFPMLTRGGRLVIPERGALSASRLRIGMLSTIPDGSVNIVATYEII